VDHIDDTKNPDGISIVAVIKKLKNLGNPAKKKYFY
jgi:hypothetical protein